MMDQVVNRAIGKKLEEPARIYCRTCNTTFYLGPAKKLLEDVNRPIHVDYLILAMRHVWNKDGHFIDVKFSGVNVFEMLGDNINARTKQQKMALRDKGLIKMSEEKWDFNWMNDQLTQVNCSICHDQYKDLKEAASCCLSQKLAFAFPIQELDDWLVRS